jgi:hypothetical protein
MQVIQQSFRIKIHPICQFIRFLINLASDDSFVQLICGSQILRISISALALIQRFDTYTPKDLVHKFLCNLGIDGTGRMFQKTLTMRCLDFYLRWLANHHVRNVKRFSCSLPRHFVCKPPDSDILCVEVLCAVLAIVRKVGLRKTLLLSVDPSDEMVALEAPWAVDGRRIRRCRHKWHVIGHSRGSFEKLPALVRRWDWLERFRVNQACQ